MEIELVDPVGAQRGIGYVHYLFLKRCDFFADFRINLFGDPEGQAGNVPVLPAVRAYRFHGELGAFIMKIPQGDPFGLFA